jgi:hypothetical protein
MISFHVRQLGQTEVTFLHQINFTIILVSEMQNQIEFLLSRVRYILEILLRFNLKVAVWFLIL